MPANSHHRGHPMYFDELHQAWRYSDDDTLVSKNYKNRPCGECGEIATAEGHDPCLKTLPNVRNACCGHGKVDAAYVQFRNGYTLHGEDAISFFRATNSDKYISTERKV